SGVPVEGGGGGVGGGRAGGWRRRRRGHPSAKGRATVDSTPGGTPIRLDALRQRGRPAPAVPRVGRVAIAPVAIWTRNAGRRAASHDGETQYVAHVRPVSASY